MAITNTTMNYNEMDINIDNNKESSHKGVEKAPSKEKIEKVEQQLQHEQIVNSLQQNNRIGDSNFSFSKIIMLCVMLTYFVGIIIGGYVVVRKDTSMLGYYLTFIAAPTATAIGFYSWKSKSENVILYKNKFPEISMNDIMNFISKNN